jgi:hypothetical protein
MSAAYLEPKLDFDAARRAAHVEFAVRNDSAETWRASEGFRVGYHLFDAETGTLIVDGARVAPDRDIAPGESAKLGVDFDLPPEDGRYQVLLSPMREDVCWYYDRGWPFLLIEGETEAANISRANALAQSRLDPRHGSPRHSRPLPRLLRRHLLDRH